MWFAFEFARDICSTIDTCDKAAVRLHQVRSGGSRDETRVYVCINTRTACKNDSGEAKKSDFMRLLVVFWSKNRGVPMIRVGSRRKSRTSAAAEILESGINSPERRSCILATNSNVLSDG